VVGWEIRAPSSVGCEFRLRDRHGVSRAVSGSSENRRPLLHGIGRIIRHGGRWLAPSSLILKTRERNRPISCVANSSQSSPPPQYPRR
jgi:hypothetical protein